MDGEKVPKSIEEVRKLPRELPEQRVRNILEKEFGKRLPKKRVE